MESTKRRVHNKVECKDCMIAMKEYPDKYFDIAVVDPQYGINEDGGRNRDKYVLQKNGSRILVKGGDHVKTGRDKEPTGDDYFAELFRISKNQIIWGANYFNLPPAGAIIWDKVNDGTCQSGAEIAYNSLNKRVDIFRYMWRGMMQGKSIEEGTVQQGNKKLNEKIIHPNQKPVALYIWLYQKYIKEGWKLLDTHVGSGSSRIAAYELNIDYTGYEINPEIYEMQEKRYQQHIAQMRISDFI